MKKIKWTNKFSGETGYVGSISKAKGYFINAAPAEEARSFRSDKEVAPAIQTLIELGEAENTLFQAEEV